MNPLINLQDRIISANDANFLALVSEVFELQSKYNAVYAAYLKLLNKTNLQPARPEEIPFLPSDVFKHQIIKTGDWNEELIFESSGTSQSQRSRHYVRSLNWYHEISKACFSNQYGDLLNYEFIGLIPSVNERPDSSLVRMVDGFASIANSIVKNWSFLSDPNAMIDFLNESQTLNKQIVLFGLSFALVDFAANNIIENENVIVIETGGMKNMNKQMDRTEIKTVLKKCFPNARIHSEYGMTELMSQAYSNENMLYKASPFMKFMISDPTEPSNFLPAGQRGLINIIDLGNVHTCSFIQTGDVGILNEEGELQVLGRFNPEELRGCVQMYED
jgi:hypothetical protein